MPPASPASSSTNSKSAPKRSALAAETAAAEAFGHQSTLSLENRSAIAPPEQDGRRRLPNSYLIQRSRIVPDPDQPRKEFPKEEMKELVASIRVRGIKQPLTVRWREDLSKYMVIDGGRRFEAATELQLEELPCWIQEGDGKETLIDQIVHNWQRVNLRPYETADALARLRDEFSLTQQQLADMTGKPKGEISKLLALHDKVVPDVQHMARSESGDNIPLTKRHLYNISKLKPEEQKTVAEQVHQEKLSAIDTERLVTEKRGTKTSGRPKKRQGVAARQRRFRTTKADVLMTFRKKTVTAEDVQAVLQEIGGQVTESDGVNS